MERTLLRSLHNKLLGIQEVSLQYRKFDEYKLMEESINGFCGIILFSFAKEECEIKELILRNSIAKASMSLKGIFAQWDIKNYQDGWAIYRNVLDRLFHIEHIAQNNQFQEFDDWSIYQQAIKQNLVKSDQDLTGHIWTLP